MSISKALVVDDSKVVRVMFKRMLEARGLGVETAASGQRRSIN
jgi:CheY-like chemotaxis protein